MNEQCGQGGARLRQEEATCRGVVGNSASLDMPREEAQLIQLQATLYEIGAEIVDALDNLAINVGDLVELKAIDMKEQREIKR